MEFKDKIRSLRMGLGATLEQVGNEVGVSKATVKRWESGEIANIRRDKIYKLAQALHTTPAYLMGWDDASTSAAKLSPEEIAELDDLYLERIKQICSAMTSNPLSIEICDMVVNHMDDETRKCILHLLKRRQNDEPDIDLEDLVTRY